MQILKTLEEKAQKNGVQFLLIGGHAVTAHGFVRYTADVDILVRSVDREKWTNIVVSLRYKVVHENTTFAQFRFIDGGYWPLDLMFVEDVTFDRMLAEAKPIDFEGTTIFIPSIWHLLALKLHALKTLQEHRYTKDLVDVINLIDLGKIDIESDDFKELCKKFARPDIYEVICNEIKPKKA